MRRLSMLTRVMLAVTLVMLAAAGVAHAQPPDADSGSEPDATGAQIVSVSVIVS